MNEVRTRGMNENQRYTIEHTQQQDQWMPKKTNQSLADFGQRLATARKAAGYTQKQLADEIGVTRRVIAYYETESQHPPANLLADLAEALSITTDQLLGLKAKVVKKTRQADTRLQRIRS